MDPLSAISLAGNVTQFFDFGVKLLSKAEQIRKDGSTAEDNHLGNVRKDVHNSEKEVSLGEDETAFYSIVYEVLYRVPLKNNYSNVSPSKNSLPIRESLRLARQECRPTSGGESSAGRS